MVSNRLAFAKDHVKYRVCDRFVELIDQSRIPGYTIPATQRIDMTFQEVVAIVRCHRNSVSVSIIFRAFWHNCQADSCKMLYMQSGRRNVALLGYGLSSQTGADVTQRQDGT